jgi:DNA-binding YbaB/EbfC family protein
MKGFGGNMNQLMKQAQKMQEQVAKAQEELAEEEVKGTAAGSLVEVTMTGKKQVTKVNIKKEAVDPEDVEMLEDLIIVAFNDANKKVDELSEEKMGSAGVPAGGLPF